MLHIAGNYQLGAVAVLSAASLAWWPQGAVGVVAGGLLMAANFWLLKLLANRLTANGPNGTKIVYGLMLASKMVVVLGIMAALVLVFEVHPIGIAVGMASMFIAVGLSAAHMIFVPQAEVR